MNDEEEGLLYEIPGGWWCLNQIQVYNLTLSPAEQLNDLFMS